MQISPIKICFVIIKICLVIIYIWIDHLTGEEEREREKLMTHGEIQFQNNISNQILAKRGPALRFVVEANIKALMSKSNSRRSKKMMV